MTGGLVAPLYGATYEMGSLVGERVLGGCRWVGDGAVMRISSVGCLQRGNILVQPFVNHCQTATSQGRLTDHHGSGWND